MVMALTGAKNREEWRVAYMSIEALKNECREEGRTEGREEGRKEGRAEGRAETMRETAVKAIQKGFGLEIVAELSGLSMEEVKVLAESIQ